MAKLNVLTANGGKYTLDDPNWDATKFVSQMSDNTVQQVAVGGAVFNKHTIVEIVPVEDPTPSTTTSTTSTQ